MGISTLAPWFLLAALCGAPGPAFAQDAPQGEKAAADNAEEAATPGGFGSPAEAMDAYLRAIVPYAETGTGDGLARAALLFAGAEQGDPLRYERGARRLLDILDRVAEIDVEREPWRSSGRVDGRWVWRGHPPGHPGLPIELIFVEGPNGWLFHEATLQQVELRWKDVIELAALEGLEKSSTLQESVRQIVPEELKGSSFLLEPWQWIGLLALVAVGVVCGAVGVFVARRVVRRAVKSERVIVEESLLDNLDRPVGILLTALVAVVLLPLLDLPLGIHSVLDLGARFVLAVAGVWGAYRCVDLFCWYLERRAARTSSTFDDVLVPLVRRTLKIFVVVVGAVFVASRLTEDLWGIVAGLSIGSLALGFAAKDSIENLFGTFTILVEKPFKLGDWILVGSMEGTVEEVGFRSTRIRTFYDSLVSVPNRHFINEQVDNMGERGKRRIKTRLNLTYDTPPAKIEAFCEGVRALLQTHPYTRKDYYHVWLNEFGAAGLEVLLYCFVQTPDWATELRERHRLFNDILRVADGLGVSFAFPTQTIHLARPEDVEHPDAPPSARGGVAAGAEVGRAIAAASLGPFGGGQPSPVHFSGPGGATGYPPETEDPARG